MFKVGDRVRAVEAVMGTEKGVVYTISEVLPVLFNGGDRHGPRYILKELPKQLSGFYGFRFESTPVGEFNISTATDQELADEYRRRRNENINLFNELIGRGFTVAFNGAPIRNPVDGDGITITRQETVSL